MIPHSENKNEATKRNLLAGGLLLILVNLEATPGFLRFPDAQLGLTGVAHPVSWTGRRLS